jgi:transposase
LARRLDVEITEMTTEIKQALEFSHEPDEHHGVGAITAAGIIGEVGDIRRFPSRHRFAAGNDTSPIPVASRRSLALTPAKTAPCWRIGKPVVLP